ncbi:hypothetical protein B7486_73675, partial [cyanobacterium TDX16]
WVRVLHLHGAAEWQLLSRTPGSATPEAVVNPLVGSDYEPAIVIGSGSKLRYYGPFLGLLQAFQEALGRSDVLITVGYSFRDPHINYLIREWAVIGGPNDRRLVACVGPDGTAPDFIEELHADVESFHAVVQSNAATAFIEGLQTLLWSLGWGGEDPFVAGSGD